MQIVEIFVGKESRWWKI